MFTAEELKPTLQKRQKRRDKRMAEELIECYRRGRGYIPKGYQKRVRRNEFAAAKNKEGMKELHMGGSKYFNDNLEPLVRYLHAKVGQHWDKVYSQLSQKMDKHSVSGLHVFQHLFDFVTTKVVMEDGKVYALQSWGRYRELVSYEKYPHFYVHPKTGVLRKARHYKERKQEKKGVVG